MPRKWGMTRADRFKSATQRTGHPKHESKRKPKRSEWGREKHRAGIKATHALEVVPRGRPSRKSTRASANRAKADAPMDVREAMRKSAPRVLAGNARVRQQRVRGSSA
jgi:hypothetical protein